MATRPLPTVGSTRRKAGIALAANLFIAVVLACKYLKRGLDEAATKTSWRPDEISQFSA